MRNRRNSGQVILAGRDGVVMPGAVHWEGAHGVTGSSSGVRDIMEAVLSSGGIINNALAREYREGRLAEVEDLALEVNREFESWKREYNRENQGKLGVNALGDYLAKYDELAAAARARLGSDGNEIFGRVLERRLAANGLYAARDGGAWAERQREIWLGSQMDAQLAEFADYVGRNPGDGQGIDFKRQQLFESWAAKNPGREIGEFRAKVDGLEFTRRMDGLIESGDYAGARLFMAGARGMGPDAPLSEWTRAFNNPGNVTVDGKNFARYATPEDGIKAIYGRFAAYSRKGPKTPAQIISIYAPPAENDTEKYIAQVGEWTGLDMHKPLDLGDARQMALLAGGILRKENSLNMDFNALVDAARDFQATGEPKPVGVIPRDKKARAAMAGIEPARIMEYGRRLDGLEKAAKARAWHEEAAGIVKQVSWLNPDRREQEMHRLLEEMPLEKRETIAQMVRAGVRDRLQLDRFVAKMDDQEAMDKALDESQGASHEARLAIVMNMSGEIRDATRRENMKNYGLARLAHERDRTIANDNLDAANFAAKNSGLSPSDYAAALADSGLSPQARDRAMDLAFGHAKEETPANLQATADGLMLADTGALPNRESRLDYARARHLTLAQTKQLMDYQGAAASVSMARANACLAQLLKTGDYKADAGISSDNTLTMQAYQLLLDNLPKTGRPAGDQEIMDTLAILLTSNDAMFWNRSSLLEQLADQRLQDDWLPQILPHERAALEQTLQQHNLPTTEHNLSLLKKLNIFQKQGWPTNFSISFNKD